MALSPPGDGTLAVSIEGSHPFLPLTGDVRGRRVVWMAKKGWKGAQALSEMWAGSGQVPSLSPG